MANIFKNPTHKANLSYNGFDMSKLVTFSSTTGELRPIYFDILQPGDKVRCQSELKTRTLPLASPAMCHINEHIEWFFVPFDQLFHRFGEWFNGISDPKSALFSGQNFQQNLPYYSASVVHSSLLQLLSNPNQYLDMFGYSGTFLRIMEDLGIPIQDIDYTRQQVEGLEWPVAISPFVAAAYQKIYYDFYRLSDRVACNVTAFNYDDCYTYPGGIPQSVNRFFENFQIHYRPRQKDFFNNILISPLFGATEIGAGQSVDLTKSFNQWLTSGLDLVTIDSSNNLSTSEPAYVSGLNSTVSRKFISPTSLRTSFALDKLLSVTQRSAKRVDKQQLAHFGVDLKDGVGTEVIYLGRSDSSITIGDVISTADTSGAVLGEMAGKGYNLSKSGVINYQADRHGILMAIYSADPEYDYSSYGLDKLNVLINSNDFPRPEFDNLGMQPLFGYQYNLFPTANGTANSRNYAVFGWQYRWSEWKTKYNVVTGALRSGRSLDYWKVQLIRDQSNYSGDIMGVRWFYVSPNELDSIVSINYDWDIQAADSTRYDTDPLIHECYFDVKKSSKMSTYGLESL